MIGNLKIGIFETWNQTRQKANQEQGKAGEIQTKTNWEWNGWKMTRTGRGHDYRATRKNFFTGKTETKYVEVKTGNSKLSTLQKKKKKQLGSKYVVERLDPNFLMGNGETIFSGTINNMGKNERQQKKKGKIRKTKRKSRKKKLSKSENYGFNMENVFGSTNQNGWDEF